MTDKLKKMIFNKQHTYTHDVFSFLFFKLKIKNSFWAINRIVESYWNCSSDKTALVNFALFCKDSMFLWRVLHPIAWLAFISTLIEYNYLDDAKVMLKRLIGFYPIEECKIELFLPVSAFAESIGITTDLIKKSAYIWKELYTKEKQESFKQFLKGKTIAIVGGSPCESGKNKGEEIDSHDIVIRFNNYPQDEKFFKDYGKKTNIWVRQGSRDVVNKKDLSCYDYVIWADDFTSFIVKDYNILKPLQDYLKNYGNKCLSIESHYYQALKQDSGIMRPTSGAIVFFYLKEILGGLENVDAYGFAFLSNDVNDNKHFFDKLCKISTIHDFFQEVPYLHDLYYSYKRS